MVAILVLLTIIVFVFADILVIRYKRTHSHALESASISPLASTAPIFNKKSILAPEGYYFYKGHTWAKR
jgi:hypothetical protein